MEATLSREAFEQNVRDLKKICDDNAPNAPQWKVIEHSCGLFCIHSSTVIWRDETIVRQFHITYNETYGVPVLWFNFSRTDGSLLHIEEILQLIASEHRSAIETSLLMSISQNEHPHLGVAFYHIHPCRTQEVMCDLRTKNYVLSWLSIYGRLLQLTLPNEVFL